MVCLYEYRTQLRGQYDIPIYFKISKFDGKRWLGIPTTFDKTAQCLFELANTTCNGSL